jgi:hypothetical protein
MGRLTCRLSGFSPTPQHPPPHPIPACRIQLALHTQAAPSILAIPAHVAVLCPAQLSHTLLPHSLRLEESKD